MGIGSCKMQRSAVVPIGLILLGPCFNQKSDVKMSLQGCSKDWCCASIWGLIYVSANFHKHLDSFKMTSVSCCKQRCQGSSGPLDPELQLQQLHLDWKHGVNLHLFQHHTSCRRLHFFQSQLADQKRPLKMWQKMIQAAWIWSSPHMPNHRVLVLPSKDCLINFETARKHQPSSGHYGLASACLVGRYPVLTKYEVWNILLLVSFKIYSTANH